MSIIKGKQNVVAGFGGTKRCIGEVYFSQSGLASDNPGALPGWTGEYYKNGKTLFPDLYNFVKAHSELQVTKAQYDSAIATYGECPKYVVDENGGTTTQKVSRFLWSVTSGGEADGGTIITKTRNPVAGDEFWYSGDISFDKETDFSTDAKGTINSVSENTLVTNDFNVSSSGVPSIVSVTATFSEEQANRATASVTTPGTSLRLPKLANYIKMANSTEGITQKGAGLPNIDSDTNWVNVTGGTKTAATNTNNLSDKGVFGGTTSTGGHGIAENNYPINWRRFDASKSNAIYGASDTVQPAHTTLYPWISAYTAAVPASTAQAAEFTGALSGKANTDLSNVPTGYDYVIKYQVNTDGSWYRKYKSGWLEQGGKSAAVAGGGSTIVTFPKAFANTTYTVLAQVCGGYTPKAEANAPITAQTKTGFTIYSGSFATSTFNWRAEGQGA